MPSPQAAQAEADSPATFSIRPARIEDAEALADLSAQLGYPSSTGEVRRRLVPLLGQAGHVILVAEADGPESHRHCLGWIHGFVKHTIEADPAVELGGLVVDEAWRGRGVGRSLIDAVELWARGVECGTLTIRCNAIRERAHVFYQKLGYSVVKTQRIFRKNVES
jgi:GNAT superfamily N-acetyltransferase